MYTVKFGGTIERGDLIAVSNGNDFTIGIYYGRGVGGTVQYYGTGTAGYCKKRYEERLKLGANVGLQFKLSQLWKEYINTPRDTRIMKLNRDNITDQKEIEKILEAKEILQEFNITVNY